MRTGMGYFGHFRRGFSQQVYSTERYAYGNRNQQTVGDPDGYCFSNR